MDDSIELLRNECGKILIWPNDNFSLICKVCGDDFNTLEDFRVHYLAKHFPNPPLIIKREDVSIPLDVHDNTKYNLADSEHGLSETPANIKNEEPISCDSDCESITTEIYDENSSPSRLVDNQSNDETIGSDQSREVQTSEIADNLGDLPKSRKRGLEYCDSRQTTKKNIRTMGNVLAIKTENPSDDDGESNTPLELRANDNLLPESSKDKYNGAYHTFMNWRKSKSVTIVTENILLAYFVELSEKLKPSSLWSIYSMLKCTLKFHDNIDIGKHSNLNAFLKRTAKGYIGKKSKTLSSTDVEKFLFEAPDDIYLVLKVALIFGISGACKREELPNIKVQDIEHQGNVMLVKIPNNKTNIPRFFSVDGKFRDIVAKYEALRPENATSDRFFLNFQRGKCTLQVIGKNKFGKMPGDIAKYLNLPDAALYTGHSFRRTSATLLAGSGADLQTLKLHGGWRSSAVARGYIEDSINSKRQIGNQIASTITLAPSTSITVKTEPNNEIQETEFVSTEWNAIDYAGSTDSDKQVIIHNYNNCNITITKSEF